MKKQAGRFNPFFPSWSTIIFWAVIAFIVFPDESKEKANEIISIVPEKIVTQVENTVKGVTKNIKGAAQEIEKESEQTEIKELEPKYIPNGIRDKTKYIKLPVPEGFTLKRHIDGTLWGCIKDALCYRVSD